MKNFQSFIESGGSPYQPYKAPPMPAPSTPPGGWEDFKKKYLPKQASTKKPQIA
jgi:hypothetical protein